MKIKKESLVVITKGVHKGKKDKINSIKKGYVTLVNLMGLSSKKKPYHIKINKSNVKLDY